MNGKRRKAWSRPAAYSIDRSRVLVVCGFLGTLLLLLWSPSRRRAARGPGWQRGYGAAIPFDGAAAAGAAARWQPPREKTLSFMVCNGLVNQRLSLFYGLALARDTNRTAILPALIRNGLQADPKVQVFADGGNQVEFGHFYVESRLVQAMRVENIRVSSSLAKESPGVSITTEQFVASPLKYENIEHVALDCPLLRLGAEHVVPKHSRLFFAYMRALQPAPWLEASISKVRAALGGAYNFLHLRAENDWVTHCATWRRGDPGDNCMGNTLDLASHLRGKGVSNKLPLYVALDWDDTDPALVGRVQRQLAAAGYTLVSKRQILGPSVALGREEAALLEYTLGLGAQKFVGNSVSTFSAALMLEREQAGLWSSYYNMGDIPLASFLPLYRMPWVFTHNGASSKYNYMVKAAVLSGIKTAQLKPYCLYNGTAGDAIYRWLEAQGVTMLTHEPQWSAKVDALFAQARKNAGFSPLYTKKSSIFGTMQRIDIPVLEELKQYNYILYTDTDVFFRRRITLADFGYRNLPSAIAMAYESVQQYPCNAGVMLLNLPAMRSSYRAFVDFTFSQPGLHFGDYGPMDQGALNQFYEKAMRGRCGLSEMFNSKPHSGHGLQDPYIVHFHGPKPHDYHEWARSRYCLPSFYGMCADGFPAVCGIIGEYAAYTKYNYSSRVVTGLAHQCAGYSVGLGAARRPRPKRWWLRLFG